MVWALLWRLLFVFALLSWWSVKRPRTPAAKLGFVAASCLTVSTVGKPVTTLALGRLAVLCRNAIILCQLDVLVYRHANMLVTFAAIVW
jgi:hypothetical protein